ncbi:unnamed protein product [Clavelina lepadiformis]|uniref:Hydantoinase A/oxoprolinase domain-containing protein n=1 Tax=Clavelina lepadiformis TaxID=159417 RepID=A0ABP0G638_CLALP
MFTSSDIKYNISHSSMLRFDGNRAILSGPAGGVLGYTMTSFEDQPSIGYNMGGTSTDLSRYDGEYEHVFKSTTAGVTIQAPQRICQVIHGPAIIIDKISTILVEPDCKGKMTKKGDVTIMIGKGKPRHIGKELDAIQLSIFSHRYKKGFVFASPGRDIINDGGRVGGIELSGIEDHALVTSSGKPPHVEKLNSFFISSSRILDIRSYQISSINNTTF